MNDRYLLQLLHRLYPKPSQKGTIDSGFTLIELLVVTLIIGVLSAITGVSWLGYVNSRRTLTSTEQAMAAIRRAQSEAIRTRQNYAVSFRTSGTALQYSLYSYSDTGCPATNAGTNWDTIATTGVRASYSSVYGSGLGFDYQGNPCNTGTIGFISTDTSTNRRCVKITTLIGAMRIVDRSDSECSSL